jgi:hypothetical protein
MKTFNVLFLWGLLVISTAFVSQADTLTAQYGVDINDANQYKDGNTLYQLFNKYFQDQLGSNVFSNSNDLFNTYGVDPNTDWTTNGSSVVGAFKVAALEHEMSVVSRTTGENLGSIIDVAGTTNIHDVNGISDLSGSSFALPDGDHIDFRLNASLENPSVDNQWSSNSAENEDGKIHMIAFDITGLYNSKYGTVFDSVYMLGWEDLADGGRYPADWDYQDFVAIITNLTPVSSATPEPATMVMFLIGTGLTSAVAWRKRKTHV